MTCPKCGAEPAGEFSTTDAPGNHPCGDVGFAITRQTHATWTNNDRAPEPLTTAKIIEAVSEAIDRGADEPVYFEPNDEAHRAILELTRLSEEMGGYDADFAPDPFFYSMELVYCAREGCDGYSLASHARADGTWTCWRHETKEGA